MGIDLDALDREAAGADETPVVVTKRWLAAVGRELRQCRAARTADVQVAGDVGRVAA